MPNPSPSEQEGPNVPGFGPRVREIPEGDTRARLVCPECGFVKYENPLIVVGSVITWEDRFLLCRRDIEPRRGYWTIPAGYLELNETVVEAALREAREEACVEIEIDALLGVYNVPRISQVQLIYRAHLKRPEYRPGHETQAVELFEWQAIPWDDIAFPSVRWALHHHREVAGAAVFAPRTNPAGELGEIAGRR